MPIHFKKASTLFISCSLLMLAVSTIAQSSTKKPPNILMIAVDDLRPELGCYGNTLIHSPNIDKLASEGIVFKNSYCNIPVCGASRASILTGTRPTQHRFWRYYDRADQMNPSAIPMSQHFKNNGYTTLSNGKISHIKEDHAASWDVIWQAQKNRIDFHKYALPENTAIEKSNKERGPAYEMAEVPDSAYNDGKLALKVIEDIQRLKNADQPFFLTAGFIKPHLPFNAPKKYWDLYDRSDFKPVGQIKLPENAPKQAFHNSGELRHYHGIPKEGPMSDSLSITLQHGYYATISYVDKLIGDVLEALEEAGLRENTIVLLWGDHGWNLGDHGLWCKHCNFNTSLQAPLIISAPNLAKNATAESLVEFIDIYPTLIDLCGLETPKTVEGKSLLPLLQQPDAHHKDFIISKWKKGLTVKTKKYAYTEWRDDKDDSFISEMLYDHEQDPDELNNLIGDPKYAALVEYLNQLLRQHRGDDYFTNTALNAKKRTLHLNDTLDLTANLLYEDQFGNDLKWWEVEQQAGGKVELNDEKLEITDAAGATIWFKNRLNQPVMIEYTATVIDEGGKQDRVSDLNCFWLASNPKSNRFFKNHNREGKFVQYDSLQLYYVGLGGHDNSKTRFRRYDGKGNKPLLPKYDLSDKKYLITPNIPNHIRIIAYNGIIQYWRNGMLIYEYKDDAPYQTGYFGFRTVNNHMTVDDFKVYELRKANTLKTANPMVYNVGMADPHIRIYDDKAYLYATRDAIPNARKFTMPDWHIWSSDDLVNWTLEHSIFPTETYMGESDRCWATDIEKRGNNYYFYFSNGNTDTGVLVGQSPNGPFEDPLKKPMLPKDLTPIKEYDATVLTDEKGDSYLTFGHYRAADPAYYYCIAKLNEDMISLAEKPKEIIIEGDLKKTNNTLGGNDKPNLHYHNGLYYLSAGSHYATSENIYGPYIRRGNSGNNQYGLDSRAHGNYFEWKNQWFHTWCHFHLGKEVGRYRESYITYLHYKDNGEMMDDTTYLAQHFETGVGQYDANWERIEAEWYMAAEGMKKREGEGGFVVQQTAAAAYLHFPNVYHLEQQKTIHLRAKGKGTIDIRTRSTNGTLLGTVTISESSNYQDYSTRLTKTEGAENVYLVFKGEVSLDWFGFEE